MGTWTHTHTHIQPHEEKWGRLPPLSPFYYAHTYTHTHSHAPFCLSTPCLTYSHFSHSISPPPPSTAFSQWYLGEAVVMVTGLLSTFCPSGIPDPENAVVFTWDRRIGENRAVDRCVSELADGGYGEKQAKWFFHFKQILFCIVFGFRGLISSVFRCVCLRVTWPCRHQGISHRYSWHLHPISDLSWTPAGTLTQAWPRTQSQLFIRLRRQTHILA